MGCGTSKLEPDEVTAASSPAPAPTPPGLGPVRRRIDEIRRRRAFGRMRKDSISTIEPLIDAAGGSPPPIDDDDETSRSGSLNDDDKPSPPVPEAPEDVEAPSPPPLPAAVEDLSNFSEEVAAAEEKVVDDAAETEEERASSGGELGFGDCPGSPSFRVYFVEVVNSSDEDDSIKSRPKEEGKVDETPKKSKKVLRRRESSGSTNSSEEECKTQKRGRKLRALAKTPVAVYSRLNVKSCYNYNNNNHNHHPPSPQHSTRRLLCE